MKYKIINLNKINLKMSISFNRIETIKGIR